MVSSRTAIIAGNWKMHYSPKKAASFAMEIVPELGSLLNRYPHLLCVLCPPTISLAAVHDVLTSHPVARLELGAQNMHFEVQGAFTGEVSPTMVHELCRNVILGHSERRMYFNETDELVNKKVLAALHHGLRPIVCIGENDEQHEAAQTEQVIRSQVAASLATIPAHHTHDVVIAYEPIWAIGTGKAATPDDAEKVVHLIRELYSTAYGSQAGEAVRILYGGSVTSQNIADFMKQPDIDGALVGGASIKPDFVEILHQAGEAHA